MLTVASVPSGHVYVRHIDSLEGSGVVRLPDPRPPSASTEQQWWPSVMLQPGWVEEHRPRIGLHLKSLRANMNPLPVLRVLAAESAAHNMEFVVDVHTDVVARVLAPCIGHYHDQHEGVLGYRLDGDEPVVEDIRDALDSIWDAEPWRPDKAARLEQRRIIAAAHERLYVDLFKGDRR